MAGRTKTGLILAAILAVFLLGFVPQYLENRRLRNELETTTSNLSGLQIQTEIDEIRNVAGQLLLAASRLNYGTAAGLATQYFDRVQALSEKAADPALQSALVELLKLRDSITSALAQANPQVIPALQSLLQRSYDLPQAVSQ